MDDKIFITKVNGRSLILRAKGRSVTKRKKGLIFIVGKFSQRHEDNFTFMMELRFHR